MATFKPPKGVVQATIDAWTGGRPGPWTQETTKAWFITGTQPGARGAVDQDGLMYATACGGYRVDLVKAELGPRAWDADVANWMARARRGPGVLGPNDTRTAYFWDRTGWGGRLLGSSCGTTRHVVHRHHGGDGPPKDKGPKPKPGSGDAGTSPTPPAGGGAGG